MLPVLNIGPLALPVPQFSLLLALWFGLSLAEKTAHRQKISADALYNLVFTGLSAGVIGARAGYVLQNPAVFINNPANIFSLNAGLLDAFAGFATGALGAFIYANRKKMAFWNTLDALSPLFAAVYLGLAFSHFASGKAYGAETTLPWGIELWGAVRHPSQAYEMTAAAIILLWTFERARHEQTPGTLFLRYTAVTAAVILFLEGFRGDSDTILWGIRLAQVFAWLILAGALFFIDRQNQILKPKD